MNAADKAEAGLADAGTPGAAGRIAPLWTPKTTIPIATPDPVTRALRPHPLIA
jgi:hypothetical protein